MSRPARSLTSPPRRRPSPIDAVHGVAARFARPDLSHEELAAAPIRQWCTGVAAIQAQARTYADYWREHNARALDTDGPLWVVLGDSTAQGMGASTPLQGYVGHAHAELRRQTGRPWRVVNLSRAGAVAQHVLTKQLPCLEELPTPSLVTCGIGSNDILVTPPGWLHDTMRSLISALPENAVMLDLPLPNKFWVVGGALTPYTSGVNQTIYTSAKARGMRVAYLSRHFIPPWAGKFSTDRFHPSDRGYRDQARAVLEAILPAPTSTAQ